MVLHCTRNADSAGSTPAGSSMQHDRRRYDRQWYAKRKAEDPNFIKRRRELVKAHQQRLLEWVRQYKAKRGCKYCPECEPVCLDFHHRNPAKKLIDIAQAVFRCWAKSRLLAEMRKCDVVCANCHRKIENGISC